MFYTKQQLIDLARQRGISVNTRMTKDEIVQLLMDAPDNAGASANARASASTDESANPLAVLADEVHRLTRQRPRIEVFTVVLDVGERYLTQYDDTLYNQISMYLPEKPYETHEIALMLNGSIVAQYNYGSMQDMLNALHRFT